jgi:hypothetical protein
MGSTKGKIVSAEAAIRIDAPIETTYQWVVFEPLERQLPGTRKLPGVVSTQTINGVELGKPGHKRLIRLADGNTAMEEHDHIDGAGDGGSEKYFAYTVRDYTLRAARSVEYARGEWWFSPEAGTTSVKWRYSFKLGGLLGRLGPIGRALFDLFFLKASYREFMAATLEKLKNDLEIEAKS